MPKLGKLNRSKALETLNCQKRPPCHLNFIALGLFHAEFLLNFQGKFLLIFSQKRSAICLFNEISAILIPVSDKGNKKMISQFHLWMHGLVF